MQTAINRDLGWLYLSQKKKKRHYIIIYIILDWASLVAPKVENPPAMTETCVQSLGWDDPQDSCLENPADRGAWRATIHEVTKSLTRPTNHSTAHRLMMLHTD